MDVVADAYLFLTVMDQLRMVVAAPRKADLAACGDADLVWPEQILRDLGRQRQRLPAARPPIGQVLGWGNVAALAGLRIAGSGKLAMRPARKSTRLNSS